MATSKIALFEYEDKEIRITDDGRFSIYDLLVLAALRTSRKINPRQTLKPIQEKDPSLFSDISQFQFPGRGQRLTPVASWDVCEKILYILNLHPNQEFSFNDKFYPRTETQVVLVLAEAFQDCEPCTQFYCEGYRIDLYLARPRIAVECDEYGHRDYCDKAEIKRKGAIKKALGCSFIRFDPYAHNFNLGEVIFKIRGLV